MITLEKVRSEIGYIKNKGVDAIVKDLHYFYFLKELEFFLEETEDRVLDCTIEDLYWKYLKVDVENKVYDFIYEESRRG